MVTLLAVFLSVAGLESGSQRTITLRVLCGRERITFDAKRISEKEVRRWMELSPNISNSNNYVVPEPLELCDEGLPEYRECGTRDWRAKNFIYNANVNLQKIRARIKELNEAHPPELRSVVSYMKEIQEDNLFFESQLLKFFQDWQTENLLASFHGIDPEQQCRAEIARIRTAPDKQTAFKLAQFEWGKCVNSALRAKVGEYPEAAWKNFLHRYSIREKFIEDYID